MTETAERHGSIYYLAVLAHVTRLWKIKPAALFCQYGMLTEKPIAHGMKW